MSDVVKTLKIKKAGTPGNVPTPDTVMAEDGQPSEQPAQGHATLPRYAQVQTAGPVVKDSRQWTAWAIVATIAFLAVAALLVFQLLELKFYADQPPVWTHPGMF